MVDPFELEDRVEKLLIYHAKTNNTTLDEAYKLIREVEDLQYLYKHTNAVFVLYFGYNSISKYL
jgi:hypothetical protein